MSGIALGSAIRFDRARLTWLHDRHLLPRGWPVIGIGWAGVGGHRRPFLFLRIASSRGNERYGLTTSKLSGGMSTVPVE